MLHLAFGQSQTRLSLFASSTSSIRGRSHGGVYRSLVMELKSDKSVFQSNGHRLISKISDPVRPKVLNVCDSDSQEPLLEEATLDIDLPRRNLIVKFTCNACGVRTQRLINRLAYEKGTVFVQCAGCLQHHKLVDNLNLVVEYDLREAPPFT